MTDRWFNSRCTIREAYYLRCFSYKTPCLHLPRLPQALAPVFFGQSPIPYLPLPPTTQITERRGGWGWMGVDSDRNAMRPPHGSPGGPLGGRIAIFRWIVVGFLLSCRMVRGVRAGARAQGPGPWAWAQDPGPFFF
jgi:hypothetical protein